MSGAAKERRSDQTQWGPRWLAAGLRAHRREIERGRRRLAKRAGVPEDVRARGETALAGIIDAIDAEIAQLEREGGR